jgi:hypothetical protein
MKSSRVGSYQLRFATPAREKLDLLGGSPQYAAKLRKVRRPLGLLQINPRHPGLHSYQYENFPGALKAKVWDYEGVGLLRGKSHSRGVAELVDVRAG